MEKNASQYRRSRPNTKQYVTISGKCAVLSAVWPESKIRGYSKQMQSRARRMMLF